MTDHFHRAARDGILDLLKEATRKDCNTKDDDGMTPTLWSAFEGNLEALRLLVGRGGDPEKTDYYGNTGLHFAAARGHMNCVTFLINYGVSIFAKDIDHHTPKDLAAMNDRQEILRVLDDQAARMSRTEPKKVKKQMDQATKDADKRIKEFAKVQAKARKLAEKEKKRLEKERKKMEQTGHHESSSVGTTLNAQQQLEQPVTNIPRPSMAAMNLRRDSRLIYSQSPKFSDLVNPKEEKDKIKVPISASSVYKKVQKQRLKVSQTLSKSSSVTAINTNNNGSSGEPAVEPGDFKVGAIEDGKRSVRSISGLRRDSEIMYVPKYDDANGNRPGLNGVFPDGSVRNKSISGATSSDYLIVDSGYGGDDDSMAPAYQPPRSSIFERPGFGGLAFRNSIAALADKTSVPDAEQLAADAPEHTVDKANTLNRQMRKGQLLSQWDRDELESDEDEDEEKTPMHFFLSAVGLEEFIEPFVREKFDLDSLMLVSEADLVALKIPLGHRLKLMRAIAERKAALEDPDDEIEDSQL